MYYPIQLDKSRNFRYGMKALDLIEKKMGKPFSKIDFNNLTIEDTATLIWAGLCHEDKELTPDKVIDLIDSYADIQTVLESMSKAFETAFGDAERKN